MGNKFSNFDDLKKALDNQEKQDFQEYFDKGEYSNAFEAIDTSSMHEQQHSPNKNDIALVYYEMFKEEFSRFNYDKASAHIDHAIELEPHNELYVERRNLYKKRSISRLIHIEDAEKKLLEQPIIAEPSLSSIVESCSMGVYKWLHDPDRAYHKWSELISDFKNGDHDLSLRFGQLLGDYVVKRTNLLKKCDIIVPVASDPKRSAKRGFEITQVLAQETSKILAMQVSGSYLERNASDHAKNLRKEELVNSYFSKPGKSKQIRDKSVLLIDDICTTGRTLNVCAKILLDGGARAVYSVVLARAESTGKRASAGSVVLNVYDDKINKLSTWYRLMRADKLGPIKIKTLNDKYGSPESILSQSEANLATNKGIGQKLAQSVTAQANTEDDYDKEAHDQYERSERINSLLWDINNSEYPDVLLNSKMPSTILHIRGNNSLVSTIQKSIAIIGSRDITQDSLEFINKIMPDLVNDGWTIISGMALGVDAAGHASCLDNNGSTIGVLANGVDIVYPKQNSLLYSRMIKNGALVSEFNLGSKVSEMRLRKRNKVIAGLSNIVFVVQTMPKGGAMNAVRAAKENARPVITWSDDKIINQEIYSGNRDIIEQKIGYGVTSNNITRQIREIYQNHQSTNKDQMSML
jgi:DNA processing protein